MAKAQRKMRMRLAKRQKAYNDTKSMFQHDGAVHKPGSQNRKKS